MKTQTDKALKTRSAIVASAGSLFYANGYANTSMDDIINASGVAKGNVYYHFKSKEDIALAALEKYEEEYLKKILPPSEEGPLSQLLDYLDKVAESNSHDKCRKGCFFGNMALEMSPTSEPLRKSLEDFFGEVEGRIRSLLKQAKEMEEIPHYVDVDITSTVMVELLQGAALLGKVRRKPNNVHAASQFLKTYLKAEVKMA
jgi:TetR/AcrR family transcriptional repressor of nem operon